MDARDRRVMVAVFATCAAALLGLIVIIAYGVDQHAGTWWTSLTAVQPDRPAAMIPLPAAERARSAPPPVDRSKAGAALRGNPGQFFGSAAYPADAIRAGAEGRTVARLAVNASGVPIGCTVVTSSGWRSLDAATCAIAIGRIRYTPARDAQGRPIASTTRLPVRWVLPR